MAAMEIEFKFHIPAERLQAVEAAMRRGAVVRTRLQARYFDTADQALAAQGIVLRLRKEGRRWIQTVKATGDNALHRLEHNVDLGAAAAGSAAPVIDPQRHQGTPVGDRLAKVLAASGAPLVERQSTDIVRLTRDVRTTGAGGAVVELALDVGKVVAHAGTPDERESPVCELELELKRGDVRGLVALARRWSHQHGLWFSTVSKAERGARLLAKLDVVPAVKAETPRFAKEPDGHAIQQGVVASCLAQMLPNASEIAAGSTDEEQIHQLRIGIRRLRTALRELAGLDERTDLFNGAEWEPPLVEAFRALGVLRDRDQVVKLAQPQLRDAGAPEFDPLAGDAAAAAHAPSPGDVVRAPAFQSVLVSLIGFTAAATAAVEAAPKGDAEAPEQDSSPSGSLDASDARRYLRKRLQRLHGQIVRDGRRFESLSSEDQHRTRKRLKRLRYLAEFVMPLFADADDKEKKSVAERYLKRLRPAQDALGEFNDEAVAQALYREATARDARAWFAVGWFSARHAVGAKASRKALGKIVKAPRFWKKKKQN